MKLTPEHELTAEPLHPTASEWKELTAAVTAMGEIMTEQMLLLEEISAKPNPWTTGEQTEELLREVKEVRRLMEHSREKKRPRVSMAAIRLPRPSPEWLLVPAILLGLLALWHGGIAFWSGLRMFF